MKESGFRCYNGAWDSDAERLFAEHKRLMTEINKLEPEARICWFPVEAVHAIHIKGHDIVPAQYSKLSVLRHALHFLQEKHTCGPKP